MHTVDSQKHSMFAHTNQIHTHANPYPGIDYTQNNTHIFTWGKLLELNR